MPSRSVSAPEGKPPQETIRPAALTRPRKASGVTCFFRLMPLMITPM